MSAAAPAVQSWDPDRYARNARFVADLGLGVVDLLAPRPGERILDLGCGDGALTAKIAALGAAVVGVDGSADQIAAARKLGLDARVVDGHALAFEREFDAVFSNAALHWMKRPAEVLAGVARALKPGGRFVAECGGAGNIAGVAAALAAALARRGIDAARHMPWYFPAPDEYRRLLAAHGFIVRHMEHFARPTVLPTAMTDWLDTFAESFLAPVAPAERAAVKREVAEALAPALRRADGVWVADYVRLRFAAVLHD